MFIEIGKLVVAVFVLAVFALAGAGVQYAKNWPFKKKSDRV